MTILIAIVCLLVGAVLGTLGTSLLVVSAQADRDREMASWLDGLSAQMRQQRERSIPLRWVNEEVAHD